MTCQKILEALENDIILKKKLFADTQPRKFCNGRDWMLLASQTILWKFLDKNDYSVKKMIRENLRGNVNVRVKFLPFNHVIICPSEMHHSSSDSKL